MCDSIVMFCNPFPCMNMLFRLIGIIWLFRSCRSLCCFWLFLFTTVSLTVILLRWLSCASIIIISLSLSCRLFSASCVFSCTWCLCITVSWFLFWRTLLSVVIFLDLDTTGDTTIFLILRTCLLSCNNLCSLIDYFGFSRCIFIFFCGFVIVIVRNIFFDKYTRNYC